MAKKRTGLQSDISSIFSGVPVPKKDRSQSQPPDSTPKPGGSGPPRRVAPQPPTPAAPTRKQPVGSLQEVPSAEVLETKVPEQKIRQIPSKVSRRRKEKLYTPKTRVSSGRQKMGIVLFAILSIVLVVVLVRPFDASRRTPGGSVGAGPVDVGASSKANVEIDWLPLKEYPVDLRDPMQLGSTQQGRTGVGGIVVKGISYSEDRKYAVIGTETVEEGDVILDTTIVKINRNSVEFEKDGKKWTQEVQSGEEK